MRNLLLAAAVALAAFLVSGYLAAQSPPSQAAATIAVGMFSAGPQVEIVNVATGLAKQLADKLAASGCQVIPAAALESWLAGQGITDRSQPAWLKAAKALGADYLLLGTLDSLTTSRVSLSLGVVSVKGVAADARVSLRVLDVATGQELTKLSAKGTGQGQASLSFQMFLFPSWEICTPDTLSTNKATYLLGEPVMVGYQDSAPPHDFYIQIHEASLPAPSWTSPVITTSPADPCARWTWDQTIGLSNAEPGFYVAELYRDSTGPIAAAYFEITAQPAGWELEVNAGAPEFASTAWGQAIGTALESLVGELLDYFQAQGIKVSQNAG